MHIDNAEADVPRLHEDRPRIAVLLVDDQRFVTIAVGRLLAAEPDIDFHYCLAAVDAIARANEINPTIILQDLKMPDIDGLTMVRLFRANPSTAGIPIIVLSGEDSAEMRARSRTEGANDYLVKLPAKDDLVACIRRHATTAGAVDPVADLAAPADATATAGHGADETLDRRVMAEFRQASTEGAPDFALMLIDGFITEATSLVHTLGSARLRLDAATLIATAHSLKGSSMTIGAKRLAALCSQVEDQAVRHRDGAVAIELMTAIDQEFGKVRNALASERQGGNPL